jgi:hypothetical protein
MVGVYSRELPDDSLTARAAIAGARYRAAADDDDPREAVDRHAFYRFFRLDPRVPPETVARGAW